MKNSLNFTLFFREFLLLLIKKQIQLSMKSWKKKFWLGLLIFTVLFFLFVRTREIFSDKQPDLSELSDSLYVEQTLQQQIDSNSNIIVPCGWYSNDGKLTPMIAGICDGGYQAGVAIKDIAGFIAKYSFDKQYRKEIDNDLDVLWENKSVVLSLTGNQLKDLGTELSGARGSAKAEYSYGKILFDVTTLVTGVGELKVLSNVTKNAKLLKALKSLSLLKLANISKACPPCAAIFKAAKTLRENLLTTNIAATLKLLEADFVKSGKTWDVFIKEYEAHHIIPVNLLEESRGLQFYYNNGGTLNFNSLENGMMLRKLSNGGSHANHPQYSLFMNQMITKRLIQIQNSNKATIEKIQLMDKELTKIIDETKDMIINNNVKINKLFQ